MKKITLLYVFLFFSILGFSQAPKLFIGKVRSSDVPVKNVDVINFNTKTSVKTNELGEFKILASNNDLIIFINEDYNDLNLNVSENTFQKDNIIIINKKAIELEEVKIEQAIKSKKINDYNSMNAVKLEKQLSRPVNSSVYTGEIINGIDFVQIITMIYNVFQRKKNKNKYIEEKVVFNEVITESFDKDFFLKNFDLKEGQIEDFLKFCEKDPKCEEIINTKDYFIIMDFLFTKKEEYKK